MNRKSDHISTDVIARYLSGNATLAEVAEVEKWAEEPDHAQELYEFQAVWLDTGKFPETVASINFDVDVAWEKVKASRQVRQDESSINSIPWMRIAAALVVAFGIGFWINSLRVQEVEMVAQAQPISETLSDGSTITLNENSTLTYPEAFKKESRKVKLKGEAFFEVEHQPEQPFEVEVSEAQIRVLGTSFNVNDLSRDSTVVFVETGKVLFFNESNEVTLTAGMTGVLNKNTGLITSRKAVIASEPTFWKTKTLNFDGTTLGEVVASINRVYNSNVVLANPALANCRITVVFVDEDLEQLLEVIAATLGLRIERKGSEIRIDGTDC